MAMAATVGSGARGPPWTTLTGEYRSTKASRHLICIEIYVCRRECIRALALQVTETHSGESEGKTEWELEGELKVREIGANFLHVWPVRHSQGPAPSGNACVFIWHQALQIMKSVLLRVLETFSALTANVVFSQLPSFRIMGAARLTHCLPILVPYSRRENPRASLEKSGFGQEFACFKVWAL